MLSQKTPKQEIKGKLVQIEEKYKELDDTLYTLQEDYNQCVKVLRKTWTYLEQMGIKEFNKYAKYRWSLDRENGYSHVCIRYGNSLTAKRLVKSSGLLEDAELYKWIENKDMICEALDEACQYIRDRVKALKQKMEETKFSIMEYEDKLKDLDEDTEEAGLRAGGSKIMMPGE
jgi:prefoldin subunit 5